MRHCRVVFEPDNKVVDIHEGARLVEAANKAGIILNTVCGGKGTCGKCTVELVDTGETVFACDYKIFDDLKVFVPEKSRFYKQQILEHGIEKEIEVSPCVRKHLVRFEQTDSESISRALGSICVDYGCDFDEDLIKQLKGVEQGQQVTIVSHFVRHSLESDGKYSVVSFEQGDTTDIIFGCAIDIGTTTVVAKLVDMKTGKVIATNAVDNPQAIFGADVIARISHGSSDVGLEQLHDSIVAGINDLIGGLVVQTDIQHEDIYELCVACNTTMNHLFLKFPVEQLGQTPFKAYSEASHDTKASKLGIEINPAGNVHTMANIAGFVGGDSTAVALAVGMDRNENTTLVMDIGTNGELILGTKDKLYAASCAAGPAFEGAKIEQGSRAIKGAIQSVVISGDDINIDVIGGGVAGSICGSGLVDAIAVLVELGIVDATGKIVTRGMLAGKAPEKILNRIVEIDGQLIFILADNKKAGQDDVYLTQRDVREIQLAKAAMQVGVVVLQKKFGIDDSQIDKILLAGAFGNYIKKESAKRIGLLPNIDLAKVKFVGNAASTGAVMALLSRNCRKLADELAENIEHVELADSPEFNMIYAQCMMF